jgi:hypothetical protein
MNWNILHHATTIKEHPISDCFVLSCAGCPSLPITGFFTQHQNRIFIACPQVICQEEQTEITQFFGLNPFFMLINPASGLF